MMKENCSVVFISKREQKVKFLSYWYDIFIMCPNFFCVLDAVDSGFSTDIDISLWNLIDLFYEEYNIPDPALAVTNNPIVPLLYITDASKNT